MGIVGADPEVWPGAQSVIQPPVDETVCPMSPTFADLVRQEQEAGRGCTVRGRVGYAARTPAEISATCELPVPSISSVDPPSPSVGFPFDVHGSNFGVTTPTLNLGTGSTWSEHGTLYLQTPATYSDSLIHVNNLSFDLSGGTAYVYVTNQYGQTNEVGYEVTVQGVPP